MKIKKYCREGEKRPKFYGSAYYDFPRRLLVCYPVPLNIVVGLSRVIWYSLIGFPPSRQEKEFAGLLHNEWTRGYNLGKIDGYREGVESLFNRMNEYLEHDQ